MMNKPSCSLQRRWEEQYTKNAWR